MNTLSWLIYLASVAGELKQIVPNALLTLLIFGGMGMGVWTIVWLAETDGGKRFRPWYGTYVFCLAFLSIVHILVPSQNTLYLIAGSEAGEAVVTSEQGKEILNDVQEVIRAQLNNLK